MLNKIKHHHDTKTYTKIIRARGKETLTDYVSGYVVAYAGDFIIIQETGDFTLLGYSVIPVAQIKKLRYNKWDKYHNKIMIWEGEADKVSLRFPIDLKSWKSIFEGIQGHNLSVIVNCELSDDNSFTIGPVVKAKKNSVQVHNFDPAGFFDKEPTTIRYDDITKVQFDDRYSSVFSKYLRDRKNRPTESNAAEEPSVTE